MTIFPTLVSSAPFGIPTSTSSHFWYTMLGNSNGKPVGIAYESESWYRHYIRTAGTFSNFAGLRDGSQSGSDNVILNKNGVATSFAVTTELDGSIHTNDTDTLTVSSGDYLTVDHSQTCSHVWLRAIFKPSSDGQVSIFNVMGQGNGFFIGTPIAWDRSIAYTPFCGNMRTTSPASSESDTQVKVKTPGVFRNFRIYVVKNNLDNDIVIRSRVNGSYGNISVTIPANTTGEFTDYVNTDTLAIDNEYCFEAELGVGGWADFSSMTIEYHHTADNGEFDIYAGTPGSASTLVAAGGARYGTPMGRLNHTSVEEDVSMSFGFDCGAKKFRAKITSNTCTNDQVFVVSVNGVETALTFTVPAGMTGEFIDDVNEITIGADDRVSTKYTGSGSGSLGVQYIAMVIPASPPTSEPETGLKTTFSLYKEETFKDWLEESERSEQSSANFSSYILTYFHLVDDNILWMQSPYVYTFLDNTSRNASDPSLLMQPRWEWADTANSNKFSREIQIYDLKSDQSVSNTKNRVRGTGRALQLRFQSEAGKDWNLLSWGVWFDKNARY